MNNPRHPTAALLILLSALLGCEDQPPRANTAANIAFTGGEVRIYQPVMGYNRGTLQLSPAEAEEIAAFFPSMTAGTRGSMAGKGFPAAVRVTLNQRGGEPFVIAVDAGLTGWHQGGPTQKVAGDLAAFMKTIVNPEHTARGPRGQK